jgi:hypothetical protein
MSKNAVNAFNDKLIKKNVLHSKHPKFNFVKESCLFNDVNLLQGYKRKVSIMCYVTHSNFLTQDFLKCLDSQLSFFQKANNINIEFLIYTKKYDLGNYNTFKCCKYFVLSKFIEYKDYYSFFINADIYFMPSISKYKYISSGILRDALLSNCTVFLDEDIHSLEDFYINDDVCFYNKNNLHQKIINLIGTYM